MKTVNVLIGASLLCFVHATSYAESLDVPADYREYGNEVEFVSHIARRCDLRLSIYGKRGTAEPECRDFSTQWLRVLKSITDAQNERWSSIARKVDKSSNRRVQSQWDIFQSKLNDDLDQCIKVRRHMTFLQR